MFISPASQKPEKMNQSESRIQKETTNYNHHNNWLFLYKPVIDSVFNLSEQLRCSPVRDATKNLLRKETWPGIKRPICCQQRLIPVMHVEKILKEKMPETDIWRPTWRIKRRLGRLIPVGYAAKSSAELTPERGMKQPTVTARPAEYAVSISTDWTS